MKMVIKNIISINIIFIVAYLLIIKVFISTITITSQGPRSREGGFPPGEVWK